MTFSLAVADPGTGQVGVAAMTAMPGVGKIVAHARTRCGAAASQAIMNPYLAFDGLALIGQGVPADEALAYLVDQDPGREGRQVGIVDLAGRSAGHTGSLPADWKGHRTGPHYACQGNRLAGSQVLDAAVDAYEARAGDQLVDRLVAALDAGEDAGGDTQGHRSATVLIMGSELYPLWDLRIDDADDPLAHLHKQKETFAQELLPEIEMLPKRTDPLGEVDYRGTGDTV
ncbi:DUF1028 domain-containing protein [Phytoactinopolyspora halotolerans]|uniref:DUF1028 domain-containing protein n=1 Tax=Phytoactinopolyspora halotolerans TaxID=1981512 RepID=A0A6L9SDQ4_9ACTN|nr:DUF1028 domain-containing protein [Phytoactinopolyspora halotolerans]NEE02678.1 DUF1028 domain-containing protein [Phytoactinopolyspora halotolerans]